MVLVLPAFLCICHWTSGSGFGWLYIFSTLGTQKLSSKLEEETLHTREIAIPSERETCQGPESTGEPRPRFHW